MYFHMDLQKKPKIAISSHPFQAFFPISRLMHKFDAFQSSFARPSNGFYTAL